MGYPEDLCRKGYLLGWTHDAMKPFEDSELRNHGELMKGFVREPYELYINNHELVLDNDESYDSLFLALLFADATVDACGNYVGLDGRLKDIGNRYGEDSTPYKHSKANADWFRNNGYNPFEIKLFNLIDNTWNSEYTIIKGD